MLRQRLGPRSPPVTGRWPSGGRPRRSAPARCRCSAARTRGPRLPKSGPATDRDPPPGPRNTPPTGRRPAPSARQSSQARKLAWGCTYPTRRGGWLAASRAGEAAPGSRPAGPAPRPATARPSVKAATDASTPRCAASSALRAPPPSSAQPCSEPATRHRPHLRPGMFHPLRRGREDERLPRPSRAAASRTARSGRPAAPAGHGISSTSRTASWRWHRSAAISSSCPADHTLPVGVVRAAQQVGGPRPGWLSAAPIAAGSRFVPARPRPWPAAHR